MDSGRGSDHGGDKNNITMSDGRKRPLDSDEDGSGGGGGSRARTNNHDAKRRQTIELSSWGFKEVLVECGLVEFAPSDDDDGELHRCCVV